MTNGNTANRSDPKNMQKHPQNESPCDTVDGKTTLHQLIGSLSHDLQGCIPGGCLGFLNHQQYHIKILVGSYGCLFQV